MKRGTLLLLACSALAVAPAGVSPADAAVVDLTSVGASGGIDGALFMQGDLDTATGTGLIDPFLRLQANGTESGYNTDGTLEFDTKGSPYTHSLQLKDIPEVTLAGTAYRAFFLDINETNGAKSLVSLDELKIHVESTGNLSGYPGSFSAPVYDLSAGGVNWVVLDAGLSHGSGSGDMFAYIPSALFGSDGNKYVYLYSTFGVHEKSDGGFEEWTVHGVEAVPGPLKGSLTITKFRDANIDGVYNDGDSLLGGGWQFLLSGPESMILTTGPDGTVTADLLAGTYSIQEINIESGWICTTQNPLTNVVVTEGSGPTVFFGNVQEAPEPAGMVILALGGAVALRKRMRKS